MVRRLGGGHHAEPNVDVHVRTLVYIEHGEGNQTLKSLNAVFRPFGLQMGVVKVRRPLS